MYIIYHLWLLQYDYGHTGSAISRQMVRVLCYKDPGFSFKFGPCQYLEDLNLLADEMPLGHVSQMRPMSSLTIQSSHSRE